MFYLAYKMNFLRRFAPTTNRSTFLLTLFFSVILLLLLQCWRPYFFLTDDNLAFFPWMVEIGRHLLHGQNPFYSQCLFGGNYFYLQDPMFLSFCHPVIFLLSLLAETPLRFMIVDLLASLQLLASALLFCLLLFRVKDRFNPQLHNGWIVFLSLSYTFSAYAIIVGSSWQLYLAHQAALPLLMMGILHPKKTYGILFIALGFIHLILSGHIGGCLYAFLFLSIFVAGFCFVEISIVPEMVWFGGTLLGLIATSPLWLFTMQALSQNPRRFAFTVKIASTASFNVILLISSFFEGRVSLFPINFLKTLPEKMFLLDPGDICILACCAAAWLVFPAFKSWRKSSSLAWLTLGCAAVTILFIHRPFWLGKLLMEMPFFGSLRWPFKEIVFFVFFIHFWIALCLLNPPSVREIWLAVIGTSILALSLLSFGPPTFDLLPNERDFLISGKADKLWNQIKTEIPPNDRIAPAIPPSNLSILSSPFSAVAGDNDAALFNVCSLSGYSVTRPERPEEKFRYAFNWRGVGKWEETPDWLLAEPHLAEVFLVQTDPIIVRLRYRDEKGVLQQKFFHAD